MSFTLISLLVHMEAELQASLSDTETLFSYIFLEHLYWVRYRMTVGPFLLHPSTYWFSSMKIRSCQNVIVYVTC